MSQTVSYLRGATATSDLLNAAMLASTEPGLKKTVTFDVPTGLAKTVRVGAHIGVFGCGVALIEDSYVDIDTTAFFSLGAQAWIGTICYRLDKSLYKRPVITIEKGKLVPNSDPHLLVLGWVTYGGGNIALSKTQFVSAPTSTLLFRLPLGDRTGFLHYNVDTDSYTWEPVDFTGDHKVLSTAKDTVPGYLEDKVSENDSIKLFINPVTRKLEAQLKLSIPDPDDKKFKSSGADTEPGFMNQKIADTPTIRLSINADQKLEAEFVGTIPVPVPDDHLVLGGVGDTVPGTIADKVKNSPTVTLAVDPADHKLHAELDPTALQQRVGGDLSGTLPNPVVRRLTGVGAGLASVTTDFQFPTSTYGTPNGGRGIGAGRSFRNNTEVRCWVAQAEVGDLYWTFNDWKSTVHDTSLKTSFTDRWNCLRFVWLAAHASFAWVAGGGYYRFFYYALHTQTNYNIDGTLKSTAWQQQAYDASCPGNVGDFASHGNTICFVGNDTKVGYTNDFTNFSVAIDHSEVLGGIDTDRYGTWLAIERDTGAMLRSQDDGTSWSLLSSITVNDVATTHLPVDHGEQWGSIQSAYGLWVAAVWNVGSSRVSYAYSSNGVDWYTFKDVTAAAFYSAAFDGVRWYATNPAANVSPAIYEMLVNSIPVLERLAAAAGLAVAGGLFALDTPDADYVFTDDNGKFSGGTLPASAPALGTDSNRRLVAKPAPPKVTVSTADPSGVPADGDIWLKIAP